jgi:hypothetical protein
LERASAPARFNGRIHERHSRRQITKDQLSLDAKRLVT